MSWVEKLKEYGVTEEEFEKFCEKYPDFKSNRELMAKLYLTVVKGIKVAAPIAGEFTPISQLQVGVVSRIHAVVLQHVRKNIYTGCPRCFKKLEVAPNTTVDCPRCGPVKAQPLEWNIVLAGDESGEILLTIPPRIGQAPRPGEIIDVEGMLTEEDEFFVYRYAISTSRVKVEEKPKVEVKPEVEVKPPEVATTVTAPSPAAITATAPTIVEKPAEVKVEEKKEEVKKEAEAKCPVCGKTFKNLPALKIHVRFAHKKSLEDIEAEKKVKKLEEVVKPEVKKEEVKPETALAPQPAEVKPPEVKPEAPKPEVKAEVKVEAKPSLPDEAVKLARVAATINKPLEEFKAFITSKFPGINIDELLKVAGVKVEEGVMKKL